MITAGVISAAAFLQAILAVSSRWTRSVAEDAGPTGRTVTATSCGVASNLKNQKYRSNPLSSVTNSTNALQLFLNYEAYVVNKMNFSNYG